MKSIFFLFRLILPFLLLAGCENSRDTQSPTQDERNTVTLGVLIDSTAYSGHANRAAMKLAVRQINQKGGIRLNNEPYKLELKILDNQGKPDLAVKNARQLIYQEQAIAIIGPSLSRTAIPVAAVCDNANVVMLTPGSTHPETTKGKSWVFRMSYRDEAQGQLMADYLRQTMPNKTIAILFDEANPSTKAVSSAFISQLKKNQTNRLLSYPYSNTQSSIAEEESSQALRETLIRHWQQAINQSILKQNVRVVYLPNISDDVIVQARLLREAGYTGLIAGSDNWSAKVIAHSELLANSIFTHHWNPKAIHDQQLVKRFRADYQKMSGEPAVDFAAYAYDAVNLLARTIELVGTNNNAIRLQLTSGEPYEGVAGNYQFDKFGESGHHPWLFELVAGSPQPVAWRQQNQTTQLSKD